MAKRKTRWEPESSFAARKREMMKKKRRKMIISNRGPLLKQQLVNFRYQDVRSIQPAALATAVHIFSANGAYDPDISGGGHQPRGFDQLMQLYDHFVVIATKITIDFIARAGETVPVICGVAVRDFTTTDDYNGYIEGGNVKYSYTGQFNGVKTRIEYKLNPNRFLGRSKPMADPNLKGSTSGNPTEQCFFHVFLYAPFILQDPGAYAANVVIEYTAILIEPKVPSIS